MFTQTTPSLGSGLLATILADESFRPSEPNSLPETSLPNSLIESLLIKRGKIADADKMSNRFYDLSDIYRR